MNLTFDSDTLNTVPVRRLRVLRKLPEKEALMAIWILWRELALMTPTYLRLGWVPDDAMDYLWTVLEPLIPGGSMADLVEVGLFQPVEGGGYSCPLFLSANKGLDPSWRKASEVGNRIGNVRKSVKSAADESLQLALLIPAQHFGDAKPDEINRIFGVVRAIDAAIKRPRRAPVPDQYTPELIADALAALRKYGADRIVIIAETLATIGSHPAIPPTTEAIMKKLPEIIALPAVAAGITKPRRSNVKIS